MKPDTGDMSRPIWQSSDTIEPKEEGFVIPSEIWTLHWVIWGGAFLVNADITVMEYFRMVFFILIFFAVIWMSTRLSFLTRKMKLIPPLQVQIFENGYLTHQGLHLTGKKTGERISLAIEQIGNIKTDYYNGSPALYVREKGGTHDLVLDCGLDRITALKSVLEKERLGHLMA